MRIILQTVVLLAIVGWMSRAVEAETASGPHPEAKADPQLKIGALVALRDFEPASDLQYRPGKGDEIIVDSVARPDLSTELVVGLDGRIRMPMPADLRPLSQAQAPPAAPGSQPIYCARRI